MGAMSTPKTSSSPKFRTWRLVVPILLAAFGALMCAGPGSVAAPGTVVLFERIACPQGAHAGIPTITGEANPQVQAVYCVQEGAEPFSAISASDPHPLT